MLKYHHSMDLENIIYGEIKAHPKYTEDKDYKKAYLWLEKQIGFYPLFLAVGETEDDIRITGYQGQWAVNIGSKIVGRRKNGTYISKNILRKKGEFPNYVLFSFKEVEGVFIDYDYWHFALSAAFNNEEITDYEKKLIFKKSWPKSKWLRKTKNKPGTVQLVTSKLYLPDAQRIWVRNKATKKQVEEMGFNNVEVKRLRADEF